MVQGGPLLQLAPTEKDAGQDPQDLQGGENRKEPIGTRIGCIKGYSSADEWRAHQFQVDWVGVRANLFRDYFALRE